MLFIDMEKAISVPLEGETKPCPICGSKPREGFQGKFLKVLKCGNSACEHLYAANATSNHGVQTHVDPEAERNQYWDRNKRLVRFWVNCGFLNSESKILDFGAGSGHISSAIREFLGVSAITCVEADPGSQDWLARCGLNVANDLENCPVDFSAVLLVELIEHIDSPVALLRQIRSHLATGGKLFLSTPCGETRSGSRRTNAYDTPEHIHFFTEKSLKLALSSAGFQNVRFMTVSDLYLRDSSVVGRGMAYLKGILRQLRNCLFGYSHLVAIID